MTHSILNYVSTVLLFCIAAVALIKEWKDYASWARFTLVVLLTLSLCIGIMSNFVATREVNAIERRRATIGKLSASPAVDPIASSSQFPQLQIGSSDTIIRFTGGADQARFRIFEHDAIRFDREDGQTKVSALIRDRSGRIVAELVKNEWRVNPHRLWDRNYTADALGSHR